MPECRATLATRARSSWRSREERGARTLVPSRDFLDASFRLGTCVRKSADTAR
jgi:hypothetical protein